jgi:hypothetical protein
MAEPFDRKVIIEFLIRQKLPAIVLANLTSASQSRGTTTLGRITRQQEETRYRGELLALPDDELRALYESEVSKLIKQNEREEETRFFNQPHAMADFDHWSKAEHWSLDEAVALAMGKAPEVVSWAKIQSFSTSPFVQRYGRLRDLAQRAIPWKKLFDPVLPTIFLKWAEDNEIPVPTELSEKVYKLKGKVADWKESYDELRAMYDQHIGEGTKRYDELRAMYDQHMADWKKLAEQQSVEIQSNREKISLLERESDFRAVAVAAETAKPQSPIERQSMLKLIYGMAVRGFGYNPEDKRSTIVPELVGDLALEGLALSDDTIRRYLKEARDHLPEWQKRSN